MTNIAFMLGDYSTFTSINGSYQFPANSKFSDIISNICQQFAPGSPSPPFVPVYGEGIDAIVMSESFSFNGKLQNALSDAVARATAVFRMAHPLLPSNQTDIIMQINGNELRFYAGGNGYARNGVPKLISFVSSAPKRDTPASISFVAPWDPSLLTGDIIQIDPVFAKQSYGGSLTTGGNTLYSVMTIEFDFSTIGGVNTMRVEALDYVGSAIKAVKAQ